MLDTFMLYRFVKYLTTPFNEWPAYHTGVIDEKGQIVIARKNRSMAQKDSFTRLDVMIRNIKMLLAKVPGGNSKLATYAAALLLLRESKGEIPDEDDQILQDLIGGQDVYRESIEATVRIWEDADAAAPTNIVSAGDVKGVDDGIQTPPGKRRKKADIEGSIFTDTRGRQQESS